MTAFGYRSLQANDAEAVFAVAREAWQFTYTTVFDHHALEIRKEGVGRQVELKLWLPSAGLCWRAVGSPAIRSNHASCYA